MHHNEESTVRVKLWAVVVGIFTVLGTFFLYSVSVQREVDAKQDVSIITLTSTVSEKVSKEQYYRDISNISTRLTEIKESKECQVSSYPGNFPL